MQGGERKVARFGDTQCHLDRFQVAHFADEYHVGILAKRSPQRFRKPVSVGVDFALIDDTILVIVKKLDRVFDRQDVFVAIAV